MLKSKDKTIVVIITGDRRVNFRKIEKVSKLRKLRLASAEEVRKFTGFEIGSTSPFIFHKLCPAYVDKEIMKQDYVIGAAGTEYAGIKFSPNEFKKIGYIIEEIT